MVVIAGSAFIAYFMLIQLFWRQSVLPQYLNKHIHTLCLLMQILLLPASLLNALKWLTTDWNGCYIRFFLRCISYANSIVSKAIGFAPVFKQTNPHTLSVDANFAFARCSLFIWKGWIQVELTVILGGLGTSIVVIPLLHILYIFACCAPHTVSSSGGPFFSRVLFWLEIAVWRYRWL